MTRTVGHAFASRFAGMRFDTFLLDGAPVWAACEIGYLLDYARKGSRLCALIRGDWSDDFTEGADYHALTGTRLAALKEVFPPDFSAVDRRASKLLVLTRRGLDRVLLKSDKPDRLALRGFLEREVYSRFHGGAEAVPRPVAPESAIPAPLSPRDARLADALAFQKRVFACTTLRETVRFLHGLGLVSDTVRAAYEVRVAELALGEELPDLRPTNERWHTAGSIARETGMTAAVVSRVITALGIRGAPGLSREVVTVAADDEKTVRSFVYNARAREMILAACGATPPDRAA